jgi:hypothetical protein
MRDSSECGDTQLNTLLIGDTQLITEIAAHIGPGASDEAIQIDAMRIRQK